MCCACFYWGNFFSRLCGHVLVQVCLLIIIKLPALQSFNFLLVCRRDLHCSIGKMKVQKSERGCVLDSVCANSNLQFSCKILGDSSSFFFFFFLSFDPFCWCVSLSKSEVQYSSVLFLQKTQHLPRSMSSLAAETCALPHQLMWKTLYLCEGVFCLLR